MSVRSSPLLDLPVELVRATFVNIVDAGRMTDVFHLGLTCQTMWTIAASFIWRTADAQEAVLQGLGFPGVITSRRLETEGWRRTPVLVAAGVEDRLARYGPLIRSLDLAAYWRHADVLRSSLRTAFATLFDRADVRALFPNLCSLSVFIPDEADDRAHLHERLLQIPVSALSVEFPAGCSISRIARTLRDIRPSCIFQLSLLCPAMEATAESNTVLSSFINQCPDLKSLWLLFTPGCKPMLKDIAHLAIEHFTLFTRAPYNLEHSKWTLPERTFASLRSLTLHGPPPSNMIGLLQAISSPSVERIELCVGDRSNPARPVLEVISKKWSHSLTALVLWQLSYNPLTDSAAFFATITPLLECHRMRECTIAGTLELPLDDEHAFQIANSWSDLRIFGVLYLFCEPRELGLTNAGPVVLAHFAEHCPRLEQLQIAMKFSYEGVDKCPKTFSHPSPLIHLDGSSLSAGDMRASDIADFVRAIFPHAVNIGCPPGCQDGHCAALGLHCDSTWKERWEQRYWVVRDGATGCEGRVSWS